MHCHFYHHFILVILNGISILTRNPFPTCIRLSIWLYIIMSYHQISCQSYVILSLAATSCTTLSSSLWLVSSTFFRHFTLSPSCHEFLISLMSFFSSFAFSTQSFSYRGSSFSIFSFQILTLFSLHELNVLVSHHSPQLKKKDSLSSYHHVMHHPNIYKGL